MTIIANVLGNLGRDPEQKNVGGASVLTFTVASNRKIKGEEQTVWVRCDWWEPPQRGLVSYLRKGSRVSVRGELSTHEHNGKTYIDLRVEGVSFLPGAKSDAAAAQEQPRPAPPPDDHDATGSDDLPF